MYFSLDQTNVNAQPLLRDTNNWVTCLERQCGGGQEGGRGGGNEREREVEVG